MLKADSGSGKKITTKFRFVCLLETMNQIKFVWVHPTADLIGVVFFFFYIVAKIICANSWNAEIICKLQWYLAIIYQTQAS